MSKSPVVSSTARSSSVAARRAPSMARRPTVSVASARLAAARTRAAQQRLDAREQHARLHGLHDVIVGAHLEAQHLVDVLALGGEDEDRHASRGARSSRQIVRPSLPGQHEVEDHQLGLEAVEALGDGERRRPRSITS